MTYNLTEEPWIDCIFLDGSEKSLGLRELFERAHEIRTFHTDPSLAEAPLMKILLAISHRILEGPENKKAWKSAYQQGQYDPKKISDYFEKWKERFDLFDPKYPFMQNSRLNRMCDQSGRAIKPPSISILLPHRSSGNNVTLFDHTTDENLLQLSPKGAVYALLLGNTYLLSGTFNKSSDLCGWQKNCDHAPMVKGYHAFVLGKSLFETLMLNTLTRQYLRALISNEYGWGVPYWERDDVEKCNHKPTEANNDCKKRMPKGYLDYLTFRGRNICLLEEEGNSVSHILITCGDSFKIVFKEPFVPTKTDKKGESVLNLSLERLFWRDSDTLFRYNEQGYNIAPLSQLVELGFRQTRTPYQLNAYGVIVGGKTIRAYVKESLPIPLSLLENQKAAETLAKLKLALSICEKGAKSLDTAIKRFIRKIYTKKESHLKKSLSAKTKTLYWQLLDLPFRRFLEDIERADILDWWEETVTRSMKEAYHKSTMGFMTDKARGVEALVLGERALYLKQRRKTNESQ